MIDVKQILRRCKQVFFMNIVAIHTRNNNETISRIDVKLLNIVLLIGNIGVCNGALRTYWVNGRKNLFDLCELSNYRSSNYKSSTVQFESSRGPKNLFEKYGFSNYRSFLWGFIEWRDRRICSLKLLFWNFLTFPIFLWPNRKQNFQAYQSQGWIYCTYV